MFKIEFRTSNDEFEKRGVDKTVADLLREVARRVESGFESGSVRDVNGNTIGRFETDLRAEDLQVERDERHAQLLSSWPDLLAQAEAMIVDGELDTEKAAEFKENDVLSVDVEHVYDVDLQLQGPTEFVRIHCTPDDEAFRMEWQNSYGEVSTSRGITQDSPLWKLMADVAGVEP